jgi:hypothetical protein
VVDRRASHQGGRDGQTLSAVTAEAVRGYLIAVGERGGGKAP